MKGFAQENPYSRNQQKSRPEANLEQRQLTLGKKSLYCRNCWLNGSCLPVLASERCRICSLLLHLKCCHRRIAISTCSDAWQLHSRLH